MHRKMTPKKLNNTLKRDPAKGSTQNRSQAMAENRLQEPVAVLQKPHKTSKEEAQAAEATAAEDETASSKHRRPDERAVAKEKGNKKEKEKMKAQLFRQRPAS